MSFSADTLADVERQAKELMDRIALLRKDEHSMKYLGIVGTRYTSSVRRQSMELTRALARLRGNQ